MTRTHTRTVDGFRWELYTTTVDRFQKNSPAKFVAIAQKRCTTDTNSVYFRNHQPNAEFDTFAARAEFLAGMSAAEWAS